MPLRQPEVPQDDAVPEAIGDMASPSLRWPAEALWLDLEPLRPGLSVEVAAECDSTSTRLLERARAGDSSPCLLVAQQQTAGRGRLGRRWRSALGDSLTFTLGLPFAPPRWDGLSLAVGVALAEALHPALRLKWPNDLWLPAQGDAPDRKLGGVLIETQALAQAARARERYLAVGIGINIHAAPAEPGDAYASAGLAELDAKIDAPAALARVARPLLETLAVFETQGFDATLQSRYAARDALRGRRVSLHGSLHGADSAQGIAAGVDADGALLVHTGPQGDTRRIMSGDVSVRTTN